MDASTEAFFFPSTLASGWGGSAAALVGPS